MKTFVSVILYTSAIVSLCYCVLSVIGFVCGAIAGRYRRARAAYVVKHRKPLVEVFGTPVIFGDGETDDLPGLRAALENRPVIVGTTLYAPHDPIKADIPTLTVGAGSIRLLNKKGDVLMQSRVITPDVVTLRHSFQRAVNLNFDGIQYLPKEKDKA